MGYGSAGGQVPNALLSFKRGIFSSRVSASLVSLVVLRDLLRSGILVGLVEKNPFNLYEHWTLRHYEKAIGKVGVNNK
jgi:hypothetical protein